MAVSSIPPLHSGGEAIALTQTINQRFLLCKCQRWTDSK